MDDFFSILIWIIIIFSFLSSILKKKTPPAPPQQRQRMPQDRIPEQTKTVPQDNQHKVEDYDILREIENMFKTEAEKAEQPKPVPQGKRTRIEQSAGKSERDYSEQKIETSEHEPEFVQPELNRTRKTIDNTIEVEAKRMEEFLEKRSSQYQQVSRNLIRKLKDPKTFREYILVSEILSRPKALRR